MKTAPTNWATYRSNPSYGMEYRLLINNQVYTEDNIEDGSLEISQAILPDELSVGNVCSSSLKCTLLPIGTIPRAATVIAQSRIVLPGTGVSDWLTEGTFYIDNRKQASDGWLTITAYDEVLRKMGARFTPEGYQDDWPQSMQSVLNQIATRLQVTIDPRTSIPSSYQVEYPNELSIREILSNIAAACGGNCIMTSENKLYICPLQLSNTPVYTIDDPEDFSLLGEPVTITKVSCVYNDSGDYYSAGTDGFEFVVNCLWATQQMTNALLNQLNGFTYIPYSIDYKLDPLIEVGDTIQYGDKMLYVGSIYRKASEEDYTTIKAPTKTNEDHELPYEGVLMRALNRKVTLGTKYYGVSINRDQGLKVDKVDGNGNVDASVVLNSDELSFYQGSNKVLYFDPVNKKYVFVGDITLTEGSISWSELDDATKARINGAVETADEASSDASTALDTVGQWVYPNTTYIDGSQIMTGTVRAQNLYGGTCYLYYSTYSQGRYTDYVRGGFTLSPTSTGIGVNLYSNSGLQLTAGTNSNVYISAGAGASVSVEDGIGLSGNFVAFPRGNCWGTASPLNNSSVPAANGGVYFQIVS